MAAWAVALALVALAPEGAAVGAGPAGPAVVVEDAGESTLTAIMGRMATYSGKPIEWEDDMVAVNRLTSCGPATGTLKSS